MIRLGLYPFFDEIVTSESVGVEKPDAKIYQIAMDRLNVTKGTSIMVGNNFDVDIMGAYNAGMQSMIINSKLTDEQNKKLEQLNYQVRQLDTLTDIMKIL